MESNDRYQCECPSCHEDVWHDKSGVAHVCCPKCGYILPPESQSSEDADDGVFNVS